jgi:hypothetical protein
LDEEDLLPGQEWAREIPRALQTSAFILVFFPATRWTNAVMRAK